MRTHTIHRDVLTTISYMKVIIKTVKIFQEKGTKFYKYTKLKLHHNKKN